LPADTAKPSSTVIYRAPSWLKDRVRDIVARWRVNAFDKQGMQIAVTDWRSLRFPF
jgi:hypothetical protein